MSNKVRIKFLVNIITVDQSIFDSNLIFSVINYSAW